ncbi:MAG TPA: DinB family protein [Bryobacteraceae bacterium]|nr:DinB family protein [Bryobacteraceae bacterium]
MSERADLLERFRRGPEIVAIATTGAAGPELDFKPAPDKWSVRAIVCHLADSEMVEGMRFRQVIAEPNPTLQGYDQDAWAGRLDYSRRKISQALETFRRLRADTYELLKDLPEEAFARRGNHTERGQVTLLDLLKNTAEHAEGHVRQIQNVRTAYKEHRAKQTAR